MATSVIRPSERTAFSVAIEERDILADQLENLFAQALTVPTRSAAETKGEYARLAAELVLKAGWKPPTRHDSK